MLLDLVYIYLIYKAVYSKCFYYDLHAFFGKVFLNFYIVFSYLLHFGKSEFPQMNISLYFFKSVLERN